ncbi:hypothetical protein LJK88_04460 [Paenibacillus sp. P26]|nr:hypothetical protein LJK88_04460 [Paenibacillus sp. P26]UUZ90674.1 hypothetical protein LJK87_33050 [Paenibacillus sp. P25]
MENLFLSAYGSSEIVTSVTEVSGGFLTQNVGWGQNLESYLKSMEEFGKYTSTGNKQLDDALEGGLRTGVSIIAAKPSCGKTTFSLFLAEMFSKTGRQAIYFTNDMSVEELIAKGISRSSFEVAGEKGFSTMDVLRHHELELKEKPDFHAAFDKYRQQTVNLRMVGAAISMHLEKIETVIKDAVENHGLQPLVVIDYLQKIRIDESSRSSDKERVDFIIEELKALANMYKLPIIAISTINRLSYNEPLTMKSLKESGGLEYNADLIFGLQHVGVGKPDFDLEKAKKGAIWDMELVVLKNRLGESDKRVPLKFYPKFNIFPYEEPNKGFTSESVTPTGKGGNRGAGRNRRNR